MRCYFWLSKFWHSLDEDQHSVVIPRSGSATQGHIISQPQTASSTFREKVISCNRIPPEIWSLLRLLFRWPYWDMQQQWVLSPLTMKLDAAKRCPWRDGSHNHDWLQVDLAGSWSFLSRELAPFVPVALPEQSREERAHGPSWVTTAELRKWIFMPCSAERSKVLVTNTIPERQAAQGWRAMWFMMALTFLVSIIIKSCRANGKRERWAVETIQYANGTS